MVRLNDWFGKEEISQLKQKLTDKSNDVIRLESHIEKLNDSQLDNQQLVAQLKKEVANCIDSQNSLLTELDEVKAENAQNAVDFDAFKLAADDQKSQSSAQIDELKRIAIALTTESEDARSERDSIANELRRMHEVFAEKELGYVDREAKLAEKSEKLLQERQKFQKQVLDLQAREQHWKHAIAPQIAKYDGHISLDQRQKAIEDREAFLKQLELNLAEREADMVRRQCADQALNAREVEVSEWNQLLADQASELDTKTAVLNQNQIELEARVQQLNVLEAHLSSFRERAAQLDAEATQIAVRSAKVKVKEDEQTTKHAERLAEVRQQRTELRRATKVFSLYEADLKEREKIVKSEEDLKLRLKNKNTALRKEEKRLNDLLEDCVDEKSKEVSSKEFLLKENATLKARISELIQVAGQRKMVNKDKETDEIEIGKYDPEKHGGDIAPPPPAFRSNTPLTALHYHVGLSGIDDADERRELLRDIISRTFRQLPKVGSAEYMRQWGEAKSPQRVRCMAYHLSWNIGFQGAKETNELARHHWLEDLKWLTKNYKGKIPASRWPKLPTS